MSDGTVTTKMVMRLKMKYKVSAITRVSYELCKQRFLEGNISGEVVNLSKHGATVA
jgi:hypothetical protein